MVKKLITLQYSVYSLEYIKKEGRYMDDYNQSASERQHSIRHDVEIIREDNETEEKDWIQEEL